MYKKVKVPIPLRNIKKARKSTQRKQEKVLKESKSHFKEVLKYLKKYSP